MKTENLLRDILAFFEGIDKYYGCKTEITEGLCADREALDVNLTTWNLSEFALIRSAYRQNGDKFMLEGAGIYYEISAIRIVSFEQIGRHKYEFIEQYSDAVFRVTKLRFHYKY